MGSEVAAKPSSSPSNASGQTERTWLGVEHRCLVPFNSFSSECRVETDKTRASVGHVLPSGVAEAVIGPGAEALLAIFHGFAALSSTA
ncbi:hypothetical protein [uncultured Jannaschia sp.]|uniref:hypothetical protein n=1 Tax=uncultured Jannaschia sp. TaxID=293347 RepID=UPI00262496A1|nr:hypothetical protein [uncultured Jannaschia sp.]